MAGTFPEWIYDGSEIPDPFGHGERAVRFLRALRHPKSILPNRAFQLDPWQERIVRRIYGPRHEDGARIVGRVALLLPRGNRKTSLSAALALLHTLGPERVPNGMATFAASDRKQAGIGFREAAGIIREDKRLVAATKIHDAFNAPKMIRYRKDGAQLEVVSSDGGRQHGETPGFVLADEIHVWKGRDLWEALTTGLDKIDNSLLVVASTAGRGQDNLAWEFFEDARNVARGNVDDPSILPILFEADRRDDWEDEALWHRVNPGLQYGYPSLRKFRDHAKRAQRGVGERQSLKQLKLNIWLDASTDPFVDMDIYDAGAKDYDLDALRDEPCWLGVDLSSTVDLSVIVACWRTADGYFVKPWFFCPQEALDKTDGGEASLDDEDGISAREDRSGAPYQAWHDDGLITATAGSVIDYAEIESRIIELCEEFNVQEIAFDPHMARQVQPKILEAGLPAVDFRQVPSLMMPAVLELERALLGGEFFHGGHPVLRHCFANVVVKRNDHGHVVKFTKPKRWLSIDGAVASAMAVARASANENVLTTRATWFTEDLWSPV
ncbi:MAG TPA: terminase TerL endonuclease subunit [Paracoccus sp. (in: a-proteobacteria)]|uniref:terminase large subunit n=1 Tax=Paracoccus sp. TaxID=267 RepID=UPI002BBF278E|nr:terminase TerL endonuclease subunit [Paracoccus sp. (in: a-proteobacteria)]HWL56413.1 terminase TerL endonuclease subunit [Paracoccus sp. (in: a-proteobacteria)]